MDSVKSDLEKDGYSVKLGKVDVDVQLIPSSILIDVQSDFTMSKDKTESYKSIKTDLSSKLYDLVMITSSVLNWEARYGDDPNQRTTIKTELNVFKDFSPKLPLEYQEADLVFLANIDPDLQDDILAQVKKPKLVAMDTINLWIQSKPASLLRVLEKVDIFFANEEEVKMLTKEANLIKAGKEILRQGPSLTAIKKGEHGALVMGKDFIFSVLAHPCEEVVDATGAGDSFGGGFMGYLDMVKTISEKEIRKAAVYGSVLASFTIEDFGIERLKSLTLPEIENRFLEFKKLVSF